MRCSRIHEGRALLAPLDALVVVPPAVLRTCSRYLLLAVGDTTVATLRELAFRFSRIITTALAQTLVFCNDCTRAVMVTSPVMVWWAKRKASAAA